MFAQPGCPKGQKRSECDGTQKKLKNGLVCTNCAACQKAKKRIISKIN